MLIADLDGVFVDFVRGAFKLHGKEIPMKDVRWDFWKELGIADYGDFWKNMGYDFWANLEWTPEGRDLWAGVRELFKNEIIICTSPCVTHGCEGGKVEWIRKNLPTCYPRRYFVGAPKEACAGNGNILIDDNDSNIELFQKHKGKTVTIPRPWNKRASECLDHGGFDVAKILKEIARA